MLPFQQILHEGATYLNYYLTIDGRFSPYSLVLSALVLIPYAAVLLSEIRRSLMLFFASLVILFLAALPVPAILKVSMISLLTGVLFALLLWDFFRGKAVQNAFDGVNFLLPAFVASSSRYSLPPSSRPSGFSQSISPAG